MRTLSLCSSPFPPWTSAHYQLCVNIRLLCMRVQNKRLRAFYRHAYLMKIAIRVQRVIHQNKSVQ